DHALQAQRGSADALAVASMDGDLRHPQRLRIGVPLEPHRRDDQATRPHRRRCADRFGLPAPRRAAHAKRLHSALRAALGDPRGGGGMNTPVRLLAPVIVGAIILIVWEASVDVEGIPPYILPGPFLIAKTLWTDGPSLLGSLAVTLRITLAALAAAV